MPSLELPVGCVALLSRGLFPFPLPCPIGSVWCEQGTFPACSPHHGPAAPLPERFLVSASQKTGNALRMHLSSLSPPACSAPPAKEVAPAPVLMGENLSRVTRAWVFLMHTQSLTLASGVYPLRGFSLVHFFDLFAHSCWAQEG